MMNQQIISSQFPKSQIHKQAKYTQFRSASKSWMGHKVKKAPGLTRFETVSTLPFFKSLAHKVVRASSMSGAAMFCVLNYLDTRYMYSMLRTMAVVAVEEIGFSNPTATMGMLRAIRSCDGVFNLSTGGYQSPITAMKIMHRLWPHFASLVAQEPPSAEAVHRFTGEKQMIALKRYENALASSKAATKRLSGPVQNVSKSQLLAQRLATTTYGGKTTADPISATPISFRPYVDETLRGETPSAFVARCHDTCKNIKQFIAKTKARIAKHGVYTKKYYIATEELFEAMCPAISHRIKKPHMVANIFEMLLDQSHPGNVQNIITCKAFYYLQLKRNPESTECVMYLSMAAQLATSPPSEMALASAPSFKYVEDVFSEMLPTEFDNGDQDRVRDAMMKCLRMFNAGSPMEKLGEITLDLHVMHSGHQRNDAGIRFFMEKSGKLYSSGELECEVWAW